MQTRTRIASFWVLAAFVAPIARAQCGDPKSATGYFLEVVREITHKYDLSDPAPIGTLLEAKLVPDPGRASGKPGHVDLVSNSLFGEPATVVYSREDKPAPHDGGDITLSISLPASWPPIAPGAVETCLADLGDSPRKFPIVGGPGFSWEKMIRRKVDGGGIMRVIWRSGPRDANRLDQVAIVLER